jgi:hypothetical protein
MIESMKQEEFRRMALWHARRKLIHGDIHQSPMATHMFVESCLCRTLGIVRIRRLKRVTDELVLCQGGVRRCWESARSMLMGLLPKPYEEELSVRSADRMAASTDLLVGKMTVASDCLEVIKGIYAWRAPRKV